ncbi:MAG: hypothetical protein JSV19_01650 [Phycisphaerales bacterium]|nr:MAG: hypothetical protein JSV19_01650 [Phycisphaerales bacterium]
MSELGDIESAIVSLLKSIEVEAVPVFATVRGYSDPDRKRAAAAIVRRRQPAAFVIYAGRTRAQVSHSIVGAPRITVLISTRHLGGADAPRLGDGEASGGFDLLGRAMQALDGAIVLTDRRLWALDEQVFTADERVVVYEQRYVVDRLCESSPPTFGGAVIAGTDSLVSVVPGDAEADAVAFAFPGIDGVFRHHLGLRGRRIRWDGQLRAATDPDLNTLEATIENYVGDPRPRALVDSCGRTHAHCVLESFRRTAARRRHPISGQALQDFEAVFVSLFA